METKGLIDNCQIINGANKKTACLVITFRARQHGLQRFSQTYPIKLPGQFVVIGTKQQTLLFKVSVIDDANNAAGPFRCAVGTWPPASLVFETYCRRATQTARLEPVLQTIGHAAN